MKKQTTLLLLLLSLMTLSACSVTTKDGGELSVTNHTTTYDYQLSDATKLQIQNKKDKIIIVETLDRPSGGTTTAAIEIANLVSSINDKMETEGYSIISSDVALMEGLTNESKLGEVITLIFQKEHKEPASSKPHDESRAS